MALLKERHAGELDMGKAARLVKASLALTYPWPMRGGNGGDA